MSAFQEVRLGHLESDPPRPLPAPAPWWPGAALVAASLLAGGASQGNAAAVAFIELLGVAAWAGLAWRWSRQGLPAAARAPLVGVVLIALVPLLQLIPLPPGLWAALPGHGRLASDLRLAGAGDAWRPVSLAPDLTWRSLLALIPTTAILLTTLEMDVSGQRKVAGVIVVVALVSVVLATAQLAGGPLSGLRFYAITNADSGVGFFSNRNHLAGLLVATMPLTAALVADFGWQGPRALLRIVACLGVYLLLMVGVGASLSRAGALMLAAAVIASLAIVLVRRGRRKVSTATALAVVAVSVVGLVLVASFSLTAVARRFHDEAGVDIRFQAAPLVAAAGQTYAPLGAGVGAFDPAYRAVEPVSLLSPTYLNHAHDDYLEVWLEAGVVGVLGILAFVVWWVRATFGAWSPASRADAPSMLPAAASVVIGLMLIHSAVDYPLRTLALGGVFAFACAVLWSQRRKPQEFQLAHGTQRADG